MENVRKMSSDDDSRPPCSSRKDLDTTRDTSEYHTSPSEFRSLPTSVGSTSRDNEARSIPRSTSENRPALENYPSLTVRSFGFSPGTPYLRRAASRYDGVADPQPIPPLAPLTRIHPPNRTQASLSAFHDPTQDPNMAAVLVNQQM